MVVELMQNLGFLSFSCAEFIPAFTLKMLHPRGSELNAHPKKVNSLIHSLTVLSSTFSTFSLLQLPIVHGFLKNVPLYTCFQIKMWNIINKSPNSLNVI